MKKISVPFWWIKSLCILYIVVWTISPPLSIGMSYRLLALACAALFFLMIIAESYKFERIYIFGLLFALAVAIIQYIETKNLSDVLGQINVYMMVICFMISCTYKGRWHQLRIIVPIVLALLAIYNWRTVQVLLDDPTIARLIVRNDPSMYGYVLSGVGGYGLLYPQVCIFPAILAWIMKAFKKNLICFGIGCVWLFTYVMFLLEAGYSIAVFATVVGAVIMLFYKGRNAVGLFVLAFVMFIGVILLIVYVAPFRNLLLDMFEGTAVTKKIHDLMGTSPEGQSGDSIQIRVALYGVSLTTMTKYPFVGGLWMAGGGGHSFILDSFAKYGLWGGFMAAKMIYYIPLDYKKRIDHPTIIAVSNGVLVCLLFIAILDTISYQFVGMILIVLPILYEDIIRWEKIEV